jgi:hypothetical protein
VHNVTAYRAFFAAGFLEPADFAILDLGSSDDGQMSANSHT